MDCHHCSITEMMISTNYDKMCHDKLERKRTGNHFHFPLNKLSVAHSKRV